VQVELTVTHIGDLEAFVRVGRVCALHIRSSRLHVGGGRTVLIEDLEVPALHHWGQEEDRGGEECWKIELHDAGDYRMPCAGGSSSSEAVVGS